MQHFGNKEKLFAAAAATTTDVNAITMASSSDLVATAIAHVFADYEDGEHHGQAIALLRGSMTNATAAEIVRTEIMGKAQAAIAESIDGDDAALRAALLNACTLGLAISRYLLKVHPLVEASPDEISSILSPALQRIVEAQAEGPPSQP
jgi:AcrR family transcriptional regulator